MNKALLSIIPATVDIVKLLPVLFLFTGFQAHAAPITTIGNLSYDGTLITGDGRTYLGLDTLAPLTHQETLDLTAPGQLYADYRIANRADADIFIGSLFGDNADNCSNDNYSSQDGYERCGAVSGWSDGTFGENYLDEYDLVFFHADEAHAADAGNIKLSKFTISQQDSFGSFDDTAFFSANEEGENVSWLLVSDEATTNQVPTPSGFAIFVLGLAGIRFARRRRS